MVCIVVCVGVFDPDKSVREGGAVLEIGLYSVEKGEIHILEPIFKRHNTNTSALFIFTGRSRVGLGRAQEYQLLRLFMFDFE